MSGSLQQMTTQYQAILDELSGLREGLLQDNEELITEIALLRGQVQDQAVAQEASRRNLNSLTKQLNDINEAIDSIDQHRRQLAQKLAQQQAQIQNFESKQATETGG